MWIKHFVDGSYIQENKDLGHTWLKTPLTEIVEVELRVKGCHGGFVERKISGCQSYWHSRTAVANESCKPIIVAERIQGLLSDGTWQTIMWNGDRFIESIEKRAFGKPVK